MMNLRNLNNNRGFSMIMPPSSKRTNYRLHLLRALIAALFISLLASFDAYAATEDPTLWPNPPSYCLSQQSITEGEYCEIAILHDIRPIRGTNKFNLIMRDQYGLFTLPYASHLLAAHLASHKGEYFLTQGDFKNDYELTGWRLYSASAYTH